MSFAGKVPNYAQQIKFYDERLQSNYFFSVVNPVILDKLLFVGKNYCTYRGFDNVNPIFRFQIYNF